MILKVLPDVPALDRAFDYLGPDTLAVGTIVRVDLHGRRVRGWVVGRAEAAEPGVDPRPIAKVSGAGPPADVVDLARWAAHRWAGRWVHLLRTASPPANVELGSETSRSAVGSDPSCVVLRVAPAADRLPVVAEALAAGPCIVVVPEVHAAARLADRLRRDGHRVALLAGDVRADQWDLARRPGTTVVGTRVAVWAPVAQLAGIVVLDEHDEALQSEQAPTWHARDVAAERARRAGVPCSLVSPTPTLHALAAGDLRAQPGGWPRVEVADRRDEDPVRAGAFSPLLLHHLRGRGRVVCVLNRLGRSRLLACTSCGATATCARCGAAVAQPDPVLLRCGACGTERPPVCIDCGGGRFKNLRMGVARVRDDLEALVGEPVVEVTADAGEPTTRVSIGTEAVLHRLRAGSGGIVAFLDLDQELLAPRYRAGEQALALVGRAARVAARLVLQTRLPDHPVVRAALAGDPGRFTEPEAERRRELAYPPSAALALVSGAAAEAWGEAARAVPMPPRSEVLGPVEGRWLVRAPDADALAGLLAAVPRPPGRLRIEVDPSRF